MIYFVQPVDGGPIKIGFSDDVPRRLKQLEYTYRRPLAVLALMDGDMTREKELHERFDHLRFDRTEQFRPGMDLLEFIGRPIFASAVDVRPMDKPDERSAVKLKAEPAARAKIAASFRGLSLAEYLSEIVLERANRDIAEWTKREQAKKAKG